MIAIPGYQILNPIYNSSRTLVYRGIRLFDQKPVVIKLLRSEYPTITELMQFRNQYTIAKNLNLPGITPILSLESYSKGLALVMEDRGFISLRDYLTENQLSFRQFLQVAIQITRILQGIHKNQIIHKDIKLQNILIHPEALSVQLIDFSISSRLSPTLQELANSPGLEGTLAYMSPEQTGRMNCAVDSRSDLYSLGVTLYQLLTGELPFKSTDAMELVHCHLAKNPTPPQELNASIPGIINDIILKLMAKNPENRYQSALGLRYDLERCLEQWEKQEKITPFPLGKKDIVDRFIISDRLYGRAAELDTLRITFEQICHSSAVQNRELILIHGSSGIGKSSLVREFYKEISVKKSYCVSGKFDQLRSNQPFFGWSQAFQSLVEKTLTERTTQQEILKEKILTELGENSQVLLSIIPSLKQLLKPSDAEATANRAVDQNQFNRIIKKFISLFADAEHPLVIFLDDVQWIDLESLRLIQFLMNPETPGKAAQIPYFLLILAYRNKEVKAEHPLRIMLENLEQSGKSFEQIPLNPLSRFSVNQLIADTLQCSLERAFPLAEIVWNKTQGNPLFIIQLLKSFYDEGLIRFKAPDSGLIPLENQGGWQCDLARIKAKSVSQDVLDFLGNQVQKLPQETQTVLKFASCLGNRFNLSKLALVCEYTDLEVDAFLEPALEAGLVIPEREIYQFFESLNIEDISADETTLLYPNYVSNYQFIHDRIQQVSYLLIPPPEKPATHLKIGRLLFSHACQDERECSLETQTPETIFGIVNQFNLAIGLLNHPTERHELAELNLIAGRKAKASTAYAAAIGHLAIGIGLLATNSWQTQYDLTLSLYTEAVEVAYLCGYFDQMNDWIEVVTQNATTLLDQVRVYQIKIQAYTQQNQAQNAVETALKVCQGLGIDFSQPFTQTDLEQEINHIKQRLGEREPVAFVNLPCLCDPTLLAVFKVLSLALESAKNANPELFSKWVLKLVQFSWDCGHAPESALIYANYAIILCGLMKDWDLGYQFGELAIRLSSQGGDISIQSQVNLIFHEVIKLGKEEIYQQLQPLQLSYLAALERGDVEQAKQAAEVYLYLAYLSGKDLVELEEEATSYCQTLQYLKSDLEIDEIEIYHQTFLNLLSRSQFPVYLKGTVYDESQRLPQHLEANQKSILFHYYLNKLILSYIFAEYHQAIEQAERGKTYLASVTALGVVPVFYFYESLANLGIYQQSSEEQKQQILERVAQNQAQLLEWANISPQNYLNKWYLVEAERERILGEKEQAIENYELAIALAQSYHFIQEEALANERAALFYLSWGKEKIAKVYLIDAYYAYSHWGAKAKVQQLERTYPQLLGQILNQLPRIKTHTNFPHNTTERIISSGAESSAALDLATIIKASQALSEEIDLERVLSKFMQVVIVNSGAEKCCMILPKGEKFVIEAIAICEDTASRQNEIKIVSLLQSLPVENREAVPHQIIHQVAQSQTSVIYYDAVRELNSQPDPYLLRSQPKSILCTPIQNQGKLIGILYLENHLTVGVFTPERLEVLKILFSQAAISIENAKLYSAVRSNERQMTQFLEGMPVGVAVFDGKGKPYYTNNKALEILGNSNILNVPIPELDQIYQLCKDTETFNNNLLNLAQKTASIIEINKNNKILPLECWITPIYDERGEQIYVIVAFQDITERQQSEIALIKAEEKYRSIFENSLEGLFQTTPDGRYLSANPALARILGYSSSQELIGSTDNIQQHLYVDSQRRSEFVQRMQEQGEVSGFEYQAYRQDGEKIWISENARSVYNDQGELIYYEGFVEDITERKLAEEERIHFMKELSELNNHLDQALDSEFELTDAAGRFVPHEFLSFLGYESIVEVKLGAAVQKEMSILFADIRDFTTLSEGMSSDDSFKFINAFLSRMEPAILEYDGFIDKYIGDEIMALFGSLTSADDALKAGISMLMRLTEYNTTRQRPSRPPIQIGIGINTGDLMLGIVGGKNRMDSTVISDAVNLASRVQNLTKNYGVPLLITQDTFMKLEDANQYAIRIIDRVKVKGKSDAVTVYEVFDADQAEIKAAKLATKTTFEQGLLLYYLEHYQAAAQQLQQCLDQIPHDLVAQIYLERCFDKMKMSESL